MADCGDPNLATPTPGRRLRDDGWRWIAGVRIDPSPWSGGLFFGRRAGVALEAQHYWISQGQLLRVSRASSALDFARSLLDAVRAPLWGSPRRPTKIVLPNDDLATALVEGLDYVCSDARGLLKIEVAAFFETRAVTELIAQFIPSPEAV